MYKSGYHRRGYDNYMSNRKVFIYESQEMFAPYPTAASPALSSCTRSDASLQSEPFTITMDPDGRCSVGGRNIIFIACLN